MKKSTRTVLAIIVAVVSLVGFTALGFVLQENGVYGPFVGDNYLTDWSNWKFVVLGLTLCTTLLVYGLTGLGGSSSGNDKSA